MDKVKLIRSGLKAVQISYAYQYRREVEYETGEKVFLHIVPWEVEE